WQSHAHDTIGAGAGLCDPAIVELVAREAPERIGDLVGFGAPFDRKSDGSLALGREAAHSLPRIVHVKGDGAGAAISATLAARAGALIADPEFVQCHPTAIAVGRDPAPLATEALRGEGAVLVNARGERFMTAIHKDAELAPRDVVARAIHRQIVSGQKVFLDCREAIGESFADHFPTVFAACHAAGIDPAIQPIPVAPAAHYHMGGIASDEHGRSSLPGLWVVGECAATGLHGANRLASNSLLEGLVFGDRVADDVRGRLAQGPLRGAPPAPPRFASPAPPHVLRSAM